MSNGSTPSGHLNDSESPSSLADRVRERVGRAQATLESNDKLSRPRTHRRLGSPPPTPGSKPVRETPLTREERALRLVFHELGETHRDYRSRTGAPVSPDLRTLAVAFKREPSLGSLLPVAGFLDQLQLLEW